MNRVKRGSIAITQSTQFSSSGSRGAHSKLIRTFFLHKIKALVSSQWDRDKKKKGLSHFVDHSNKCNNKPE